MIQDIESPDLNKKEVDNNHDQTWFMIVNPKTNGGKALLDMPQISRHLHDEGVACDPHFTERKYHASELVVTAVTKGYRKLIVIGGDGTMHEVVNGLFVQKVIDPRDVTIAFIGVGTGGNWLLNFGFKEGDYLSVVRAIKNNSIGYQDIGVVNYEESRFRQDRYMVGVAGTGFDSYAVKRFSHKLMKGNRSKIAYLLSLMGSYIRYKHKGVKIYADGELIYNGLLFSAAVGIGRYNIGGVQQLPAAIADDGLLDMTIFRPIHFWHIIFRFLYLYDGNLYRIGHAEHHRARTIRIESIPEMSVEVDGEILGDTPLEFSVLDKALKIIVSPQYHQE